MHSIRLRGPWQFVIDPDNTDASRAGKISLPGDWAKPIVDLDPGSASQPTRIMMTRTFNAPTGIESSKIYIVIENLGPPAELRTSLTINDQQVEPLVSEASDESRRFDVTPHLAAHNQLAIQVTLNPTRNYFGEVTIQIHDQ